MSWVVIGLIALALIIGAIYWWASNNQSVATLDRLDGVFTSGDAKLVAGPVQYGDAAEQVLYVHRASEAGEAAEDKLPVLVWIHGGSWRDGDPADYGFVARNLAKEGFVVVNKGYRKEERGKFPAMLQDGAVTLRWIVDNIDQHGGDPDRIYLMGHSAGAYNAVMLSLDRQWIEREGLADDVVDGVIGLAGPYDFLPFDSDSTKLTFGDVAPPESTQPINFARADAPPMLFLHGTADTVVFPRNSTRMAAALNDAGADALAVELDGVDHIAILTALARPFDRDDRVKSAVTDWLKARTDGDKNAAPSAAVQAPEG